MGNRPHGQDVLCRPSPHATISPKVSERDTHFLEKNREGAFVALALIDSASRGGWWQGQGMLKFPGIEGKEPLEILRVVKRLNDFMLANNDIEKIAMHFNKAKLKQQKTWVYNADMNACESKDLPKYIELIERFGLDVGQLNRPGIGLLEETLSSLHLPNAPSFNVEWQKLDETTRLYLMARATHIVYHGDEGANVAYPEPSFAAARILVDTLTELIKWRERRIIQTLEERGEAIRKREKEEQSKKVKEESAKKAMVIYYPPAEVLPARVLNDNERKEILIACDKELAAQNTNVKWIIDEIINVCELLRKPENILKVASGRFIEKGVPSLKYVEMTHQMEQELMRLSKYTAWAEIAQEKDGKQMVVRCKIQTRPLPDALPDADERRAVIERNTQQFYVKRDELEEEIRSRQERWRGGRSPVREPPFPRSEGSGDVARNEGPPPRKSRLPPA